MGKRNCAVEGCNALEFRTTGVCNRHQGMIVEVPEGAFEPEQVQPEEQTPTYEQFECPRGCGTMSYEETQVGFTDLSTKLSLGIMVLAGFYFVGSFLVYDWSNSALATNGYPPHPHIGFVVLLGAAFLANAIYGIILSKTHHCDSCRGIMLEEKEMAYIFDEPSLVKLNSLIDGMSPSSSDLQCPICDEKMGTFSVPYIPPDDNRRRHRAHSSDEILVGLALNLVVSAVKAAIPNAEKTMDLDACRECRVVWFDASERSELEQASIK